MSNKISQLCFDAADLPEDQQFATWSRFIVPYDPSQPEPAKGFAAKAYAWQLGPIVLTHNRLPPVRMLRTAAKIRSDNFDHYALVLLLEGSWRGDLDGKHIEMGTDDFCMMDLTRPIDTVSPASESITMLVPRSMLDEVLAPFDIHGLSMTAGAGRLFSDYVKSLVRNLPDIEIADADAVAKATRDHLALTLTTARRRLAQPVNPAILSQAKRHIAANLKTDLSADTICAAIKTSRSSLYRAFEQLGGVSAFVQRRRLEKAHAILSKVGEHRTIAEIAFEVGFSNVTHFYRQFRKAFGYTAGELRAQRTVASARAAPDPDDRALHETFEHWGRRLQ